MKHALFVVITLFLSSPAFAVPVTFVDASSDWEYTFINEIGPGNNAANWGSVDYTTYINRTSSSIWSTGTAAFGNRADDYNTYWAANTDIAIRQTFQFNGMADDLLLNISVDNGYAAFLNGTLIGKANAGGYIPASWEYSVAADQSLLMQGSNEIVVLGEDYGGLTFLDLMLTSSNVTPLQAPPVTQVPEPGALALFGLGLAGLWGARRKKVSV